MEFSRQNTGVGSHSLQWIFPTQGSNPGLLHCRQFLNQLSHKESPCPLLNMSKKTIVAKRQCLSLQAVQKYEKSIENTVSKQHPTILYRVLTFGKFFHHHNILLTAFINLTDRLGLKPPIYSTEHLIKATNNKTEQYEADLQN